MTDSSKFIAPTSRARLTSKALKQDAVEIGPGQYNVFLACPLGRGGMSTVYPAQQLRAARRNVALKLYDNLPKDPEERARFRGRIQAEIAALAAINHPNIVAIIDSGTIAEGPLAGLDFIVMEYVAGGSLQDRMEQLAKTGDLFPPSEVAAVLHEIGKALRVLLRHNKDFVHRDIKPGNILIDAHGRIKLADFSLARIEGASTGLTRAGLPIGTPEYMGPEQAKGESCDFRSDQWSLGAVLYHMGTGRPPHGRLDSAEGGPAVDFAGVLYQNVYEEARRPRIDKLNPDFPTPLAEVIHRMLATDPAERYPSVDELLAALEEAERRMASAPAAPASGGERPTVQGHRDLLERFADDLARLRTRVDAIFGPPEERTAEFFTVLHVLAKDAGLLPLMQHALERSLGRAVPDFPELLDKLLAARSHGVEPPAEVLDARVSSDPFLYATMDLDASFADLQGDAEPRPEIAKAIVGFLERALDDSELARFAKTDPSADSRPPLSPEEAQDPERLRYLTWLMKMPATPRTTELGPDAEPAPAEEDGEPSELDKLFPPGHMVARYRIERKLGEGASGAVYKAHDTTPLDRDVAIKILKIGSIDLHKSRERFEREAKNAAQLDHPNVVPVYDYGVHQERPYIVMKYVAGRSLRKFMAAHFRMNVRLALTIARHSLLGCHAAHALGLVHRDIKPENIMIVGSDREADAPDTIEVKVTDFGLMRSFDRSRPKLTEEGVGLGTPEYMSPEQVRDVDVGPETDQYSMGICLYEMFSSASPYDVENPDSIMAWAAAISSAHVQAIPLSSRVAVPKPVEDLVHRMIAKDPARRFPDSMEAVRAIDALLAKEVRGELAPTPPRRPALRIAALALAAVLALVAGAFWNPFKKREAGRDEDVAGLRRDSTKTDVDSTKGAKEAAHPETGPEKNASEKGEVVKKDPEKKEEKKTPDTNTSTDSADKPEKREDKKETPSETTKTEARPITARLPTVFRTPEDRAFLQEILDLAARERPHLLARTYAPFASALEERGKRAGTGVDGQPTYRIWCVTGPRELARLADDAVEAHLVRISNKESQVTLKRRDGIAIAGKVVAADTESVTVETPSGQRKVAFSELATEEFLNPAGAAKEDKAELAFRALSASPGAALAEVLDRLPQEPTLALWIPVLVRLAREDAMAIALAGQPEPARALFGALVRSWDAGEEALRISSLFPELETSDFAIARKEETALGLLKDRPEEIAVRYEDTAAYVLAAKTLLAKMGATYLSEQDPNGKAIQDLVKDLPKSLTALDPKMLSALRKERENRNPGSLSFLDLVNASEGLQWDFPPADKPANRDAYFRPSQEDDDFKTGQPIFEPMTLKDPKGLRRLVRVKEAPVASAANGGVLAYRWRPLGANSHWRFYLTCESATSRYLALTATSIALFEPNLSGGADIRLAPGRDFQVPASSEAWRTLTFLPIRSAGGGVLLVYADGDPLPVLRVSARDARLTVEPAFAVSQGELQLKNMIVPTRRTDEKTKDDGKKDDK